MQDDLVKRITDLVIQELNKLDIKENKSVALGNDGVSLNVCHDNCEGCGYCVVKKRNITYEIINAGADRITTTFGVDVKNIGKDLAKYIDHTLLKPQAKEEDIIKLCKEAKEYNFASVCVNPSYVKLAAQQLANTDVKVCTVVGFPLGATTTLTKVVETRDAISDGAEEIDMVINVGALKSGRYDIVKDDIKAVRDACKGYVLKVIIETALLTDEEKVLACRIAKEAGADFVKTSTGFGPGGATVEDVRLMRQTVGDTMGVKASGGIRDFQKARAMILAGANRIGASASVAIMKGIKVSDKSNSLY